MTNYNELGPQLFTVWRITSNKRWQANNRWSVEKYAL
jgi:hypothetical protein